MKLLPEVKKLEIKEGYLSKTYFAPYEEEIDGRLKKVIDGLPSGKDGVKLLIHTEGKSSEAYTLSISEDTVLISSEGLNGIFYGLQTLRQILKSEEVPCLWIQDEPDFAYRGVYHDISRGKVPTVQTLKNLIDWLAYFKMNSLQLYVEHTYEFKETAELIRKTGYISCEEIAELDRYCYENFIEFIPSVATFGHMYEILEQEPYQHLRVCKDDGLTKNFWRQRMVHHTIDPLNEESFELVKSLIEQYEPLFRSDTFNICGDETFDLKHYGENMDVGKLYFDFIQKIIGVVHSKGKKVMMWADILLKHPEFLERMPGDICYLNWDYAKEPPEEKVKTLADMGKKQIVCPGTGSWSRFCEDVDEEEGNITRLIDYGYQYGAVGVLNTNWGDYANPGSLELVMYGLVLGGAKSWAAKTKPDESFCNLVNCLLYGGEDAVRYIKRLSRAHSALTPSWGGICTKYFEVRYGETPGITLGCKPEVIPEIQKECLSIIEELNSQTWDYDEAREEMILCARGICVLAQLGAKLFGVKAESVVSATDWMQDYKEKWLQKNKESEISKIEEMILFLNRM